MSVFFRFLYILNGCSSNSNTAAAAKQQKQRQATMLFNGKRNRILHFIFMSIFLFRIFSVCGILRFLPLVRFYALFLFLKSAKYALVLVYIIIFALKSTKKDEGKNENCITIAMTRCVFCCDVYRFGHSKRACVSNRNKVENTTLIYLALLGWLCMRATLATSDRMACVINRVYIIYIELYCISVLWLEKPYGFHLLHD